MPVVINGSTGISGVDGSAGTPAYQGSDTNTGVFFPAADTIAFGEGGTEVMRIDSSGNVGIGTSSPGARLDVVSSGLPLRIASSTSSGYAFSQYGQASTASQNWHIGSEGDGTFRFYNGNFGAGTERMRINSSGNLLVGTTTENYSSTANAVQILPAVAIICSKSSTGTVNQIVFNNGNGQVGFINTSGSSTVFSTSSDYRLKHDIEPMVGSLALVSSLKPCIYKWNVDGSYGEGFIAHELAEHVPLAVSGEKDAVNENGNPLYQGVDYSKIVVHLVAAVQELKTQNDALEARIAALEKAST